LAPSCDGTGTGDWKTNGQHYRRCQGVHIPVPAAVRGTTEGGCGLISKQVHNQLSRCNPLFHFLNVLVPTGFVLVCQKQLYSRKIFKLGDETLQYKQELVVEGQRSRSRGRQIIQTVNASKQQMGTTPNFRVI